MSKKVVFLVITLMFSVSLSGCLGRVGGNGDGDRNMGSPEEVNADDYNVLYVGHSLADYLLRHWKIMHTLQVSQIIHNSLK